MCCAAVSPDDTYNEILKLQGMIWPELEDQLKKRDEDQTRIVKEESEYRYIMKTDEKGFVYATRIHASEISGE